MERENSVHQWRLSTTEMVSKNWLIIFLVGFGLWNLGPFAAPVLMKLGWEGGARVIYTAYAPFCHQMAQRSFFFFGEKIMYNIEELPVATSDTATDMLTFRRYTGDEQFGWKVAWSDRMVYLYGSIWLAALLYAIRRRYHQPRPLSPYLCGLLLLPMLIDAGTHFLSDLGGFTLGFRYTNEWLAEITGHSFSAEFYAGDSLGSFNSWMRLLSSVSFAFACVWLAFPFLDRSLQTTAHRLGEHYTRLDRA